MAITITHPFVSAKGDGTDATLVRPSNWNANHNTSMATGKLIGRATAGVGAFEEITISSLMISALAAATVDDLLGILGIGAFKTGDVKWSYSASPSTGWFVPTSAYPTSGSTIGDASSGATARANADVLALWTLIYNNVTDTYAPVSGGRTGNAANDFNAHKTMGLYIVGRAVVGAGNGAATVSTRDTGTIAGAETVTLSSNEMPSHYHTASIYDPTHSHTYNAPSSYGYSGNTVGILGTSASALTSANATNVRVNSSNGLDTTYSTGGGQPHANLQPLIALRPHIKL